MKGDLAAIGPLLALAAGAVAVLLADAFFRARALCWTLAIASLGVSLLAASGHFRRPPGPAFGGLFVEDRLTAAATAIAVLSAGAAALSSGALFPAAREATGEFLALLLAAPAGMGLLAGARHPLLLVLGIEILSIALYALVAFDRERARSVEAGLKYFLLGSLAAGALVYGSALAYAGEGSFDLDALRSVDRAGPLAVAGACLLLAALLFKISAAPFHAWTPDVYEGAPTPLVGFLAAGTKAAAAAALLRWSPIFPAAATLLAIASLATMLVGNLGALLQGNAKRLLAYSAIGHAGTILLAAAALRAGDPGGGRAVVFYLLVYAPATLGAFALVALVERDQGGADLEAFRGLARRRPWLSAGLALFLLSLGGLPPTGGFFGKLFVFASGIRAGLVPLVVAAVALSVVALGYYLRVVGAMYLRAPAEEGAAAPSAPLRVGLVALACAAAVIALGLAPGLAFERLWGLAALP